MLFVVAVVSMVIGEVSIGMLVAALVPGDIVLVESGDLVPADGRSLASATLETQEASLTGESAPNPKDPTNA